jgi:hypothetical protein
MRRFAPLLCLAIFHAPDGTELTIDTSITAIRGVEKAGTHVAPGTRSLIYAGGEKFGVRETQEQVRMILKTCKEND